VKLQATNTPFNIAVGLTPMRHLSLILGIVASLFTITQIANATEPLQAGIAVTDITPPIPFRMSGYFNERLSTATKDPLHAKAVVFKQGDELAAFVFCDMVGVSHDVAAEARAQAKAATGIPVENIAVAATHSHTGPLYYGALSDYFSQRSIAKFGRDPYDPAPYRAELVKKIVAAIVDAKAALAPVELKSGYAIEDRLAFNRRFHMKDGSVRFNPGNLNPDIVRVAGPVDPQVGIISLTKPGADKPSAAIVSFAMHLDTVSGTQYSADYPKVVEDLLRKTYGPDFALLFGAGTCGNINHIDVTKKEVRKTPEIGQLLGETVEKALQQGELTADGEPSLAVRSTRVDTPLQTYSEGETEQARKNLERVGTRDLPFLGQVEAYKIVDLKRRPGNSVPLEVQAFRLNKDTAIVTLPAEIFVEIGLAIKAASPFKTTLVIELTNDSLGYIPTRQAFAEGSYETVNSRIVPGSGEKLVEAATQLLKELD
jgi:neutral ceramidase